MQNQSKRETTFENCSIVNVNVNHPRLAPVQSRNSVGRAMVITSGGRGFDSRRGRRFFPLPRAICHFLSRANTQWKIYGFTLAL